MRAAGGRNTQHWTVKVRRDTEVAEVVEEDARTGHHAGGGYERPLSIGNKTAERIYDDH